MASNSSNVGAWVGGSIGVIIAVALLLWLIRLVQVDAGGEYNIIDNI